MQEQTFISHLIELRDRLLRAVLVIMVLLLALFPFGNDIYLFIADPLMAVLPEGTSMIATQVASPFLTPFKLALVTALFIGMPYLLYQFWAFVAPGLYQHEKSLAFPILISSILLFYAGAAFAYFVVFPLVFAFLTSVAPEGVAVMTDITHYLDFVLTLFFAFGLSFEVPIATILLVITNVTTPEKLASKRPFVIVGAFVLGMLLTPPDIISQTLLAVPIWVLFEVGIMFSRMFVHRRKAKANDETDAGSGDTDDGDDDYRPLTEEEMEKELDALDVDDDDWDEEPVSDKPEPGLETESEETSRAKLFEPDDIDNKLHKIAELREQERYDEARKLLYEVLAEGNASQKLVAKNILQQMDT